MTAKDARTADTAKQGTESSGMRDEDETVPFRPVGDSYPGYPPRQEKRGFRPGILSDPGPGICRPVGGEGRGDQRVRAGYGRPGHPQAGPGRGLVPVYCQQPPGKDILDADVIIGPIANDTIFDTLGILTSGYLDPEKALRLLRIGPAYTQVAVKTDRAVSRLRWTGSETADSGKDNTEEQKAYLKEFAAELAKMEEE